MKEVDRVIKYFEEADPKESRVVLHIATKKVEEQESRYVELVSTPVARNKRTLSPEARERIAAGQRKRHAEAARKKEKPGRKPAVDDSIPDAPAYAND